MSNRGPGAPGLVRAVGRAGLALLVLNSMLGAGIFALPGAVAAQAGAASHWLFLVIGLLFGTVVLTFSELSGYYQRSGGPILYAETAFGPLAGFSAGWLLYVSRLTAFAANTTAMAVYLGAIWPWVGTGAGRSSFILLIVASLTAANYIGVREGVKTVAVFTVFKLTPILLLVLLGLKEVTGDDLLPASFPGLEDFGGLALLVIYAFVGFEAPTAVSGEARDATHNMPRAILWTVIAVAVLYALIMLVFTAVIPQSAWEDSTLSDLGRVLFGPWGAVMVACAAVFSIGGNLAANMLSVPRLTFAMGERGMLPRWFGAVQPRFRTPGNSVLVMGGLGLLFALSGSFAFLATASSLMRLLTYILCISSLPRVRRAHDRDHGSAEFRLRGGLVVPLVALSLCLWITVQAQADAWLLTFLLWCAGLVLYRIARPSGAVSSP